MLGVGLTVTGMLGGLFTNFIPGIPDLFQTVGLATPQGWAVRLWKLVIGGAPLGELASPGRGAGGDRPGLLRRRRAAAAAPAGLGGTRMRWWHLLAKDLLQMAKDWKSAVFLLAMPLAFTSFSASSPEGTCAKPP